MFLVHSSLLALLLIIKMRRPSHNHTCNSLLFLLIFSLYPLSLTARPFVLVLSQEDLKDGPTSADDPASDSDTAEWDEFGDSDSHKSEEELDPGSWRPIFETESAAVAVESGTEAGALYYSGVRGMLSAVSSGDVSLMEEAAGEIEAAEKLGYPAAQSVLGFLYGMGLMRERSKAKAFLYYHFAAEGGNMQSKMALAYIYRRQDVRSSSTIAYCVYFSLEISIF